MNLKSGYIDLKNASIYYQEAGDGLPVVMIHCGILNHKVWDEQFGHFSKDFRAVRYDCRNHGLSHGDAGTGDHCFDLLEIMERLGIENAVLMGLSMGAGIALDLALKRPGLVKALVLASPGFAGYGVRDHNLLHNQEVYREALKNGDREAMVECFQRSWTDGPYRSARQVPWGLREKVHAMAMATVSSWQEGSIDLCPGQRLLAGAAKIWQPALLVVGNLNTPGILDTADILAQRMARAQKAIIPHVAHFVNMEAPRLFNRIATDFINNL